MLAHIKARMAIAARVAAARIRSALRSADAKQACHNSGAWEQIAQRLERSASGDQINAFEKVREDS